VYPSNAYGVGERWTKTFMLIRACFLLQLSFPLQLSWLKHHQGKEPKNTAQPTPHASKCLDQLGVVVLVFPLSLA
jgi:hypothetical protein